MQARTSSRSATLVVHHGLIVSIFSNNPNIFDSDGDEERFVRWMRVSRAFVYSCSEKRRDEPLAFPRDYISIVITQLHRRTLNAIR